MTTPRSAPTGATTPGRRLRARRAVLAAALLLCATAVRADVRPLAVDLRWDLPVTAGAAAGDLLLSSSLARPGRCGWCDANRLDAWMRDRLRWSDPRPAGTASSVLASGVIPAAALANSFFSARQGGRPGAVWEDALVIAEAASVAGLLDGVVKDATARRRPDAGPTATGSANRSFYSGHATLAFSVAAASATVSSLRGYPSAPWVWAGGMSLAAATAYLRVAADRHWGTDVLAGAAAGGLVGWAVPWVFHRVRPGGGRVVVSPAPGGFALAF